MASPALTALAPTSTAGIAHVLAIPVPAQGHITPLMRLCKILASHNILITFVNAQAIQDRLTSTTASANHPQQQQPLPLIRTASIAFPVLDLKNDFKFSSIPFLKATEALGDELLQLTARLAKEGPPVTCILSDLLMSTASQQVADQLHLPRVVFITNSQSYNLFFHYICKGVLSLDDVLDASLKNDTDMFCDALPGLPPLRNVDITHFRQLCDDTDYTYRFIAKQTGIATAKGDMLLVNSFQELEAPAFDVMSKEAPVYPVGPLIEDLDEGTHTSLWKEDESCLKWLDRQTARSVLYISFGTMAILSKKQIEEMILGLEASNQRFLWSLRSDSLAGGSCKELLEEFRTRTKDRGYVVSWAPQTRVLAHPSVGGFLTHCGWNSVTEAVAQGVPMVCWPYYADQLMNCKFVVEEWKAGMRLEAGEGGVVERAEMERVVRALMEDDVVRKNATSLSEAGRLSRKTGGSSDSRLQALVRFIQHPSSSS